MVVLASEGLPENSTCLHVSLACNVTTSLTARFIGPMLAPWTVLSGCANTWWRHQMETISALLALCAGNSPVAGEFPSQRPVTRSFDVLFDLCPNKRLGKQLWGWWFETPVGSSWRHCYENGVGMHGISCGGGWGWGWGVGVGGWGWSPLKIPLFETTGATPAKNTANAASALRNALTACNTLEGTKRFSGAVWISMRNGQCTS